LYLLRCSNNYFVFDHDTLEKSVLIFCELVYKCEFHNDICMYILYFYNII
jgi:hypothetical protein